jgi:hypothetical protein
LIAWLRIPGGGSRFFHYLGALLVAVSIAETIGGFMSIARMVNFVVYNLLWPVEVVLLLLMCRPEEAVSANHVRLIGAALGAIMCWEVWAWGVWDRLLTISITIGAAVITGLFGWLLWLGTERSTGRLRTDPRFWACSAITIYFGACTPIIGTFDLVNERDPLLASRFYWFLQIVCIIHYLMLGYACILERRNMLRTT